MDLQVSKASVSENFNLFFESDKCDIFHLPGILDEVYNNDWYSVLITENSIAFYHVFSPNKIEDSDYFDIEPFLGYNGFIINKENPDQNFVSRALQLYKEYCYENKIIAEIVRFNPVLNNLLGFINNDLFYAIDRVKEIVIANCHNNINLACREIEKVINSVIES